MSSFEGWGPEEPEFALDSQRMGCHIPLSRFYTEQGGPGWEEVRSREAKPSLALGASPSGEEAVFPDSHKAVLCMRLRISEWRKLVSSPLIPTSSDHLHCRCGPQPHPSPLLLVPIPMGKSC